MSWYYYLLEVLAGAFLANGVPHFVQGMSGHWFQSPFAKPPGEGESSPVVNAVWGFANFVAGLVLLHFFRPRGPMHLYGCTAVGVGVLVMAVMMANWFGKVRNTGRQDAAGGGLR